MNFHHCNRFILAIVLLMGSVSVFAQDHYRGPNRDDNGNIVPTPRGENCVEPIADMRANHMEYLLHKRVRTMRQGIRTKQHSIVECINCHATPAADGHIARITDKTHFCTSCHQSASVKLDCFRCHTDVPVSTTGSLPLSNPLAKGSDVEENKSLATYIARVR